VKFPSNSRSVEILPFLSILELSIVSSLGSVPVQQRILQRCHFPFPIRLAVSSTLRTVHGVSGAVDWPYSVFCSRRCVLRFAGIDWDLVISAELTRLAWP
jgi:hypothetical protein